MPAGDVIAERTRGVIPITWDALLNDARFGDDLLYGAIQLVEETLFGEMLDEAEEQDLPYRVIDFAAKLTAIELINPGIDFWMNQPLNESATGTNEVHVFTERVDKLLKLREQLLIETRRLAPEIEQLIDTLLGFRRAPKAVPGLTSINDELLTPSPREFPRPFIRTAFS